MQGNERGGFYISQIKQIQSRIFEKLLKDLGIEDINGANGRILFVLWQEDNLTISQIGEKTSLAKTTLTSMLDRMEEKGTIKRNFDPADRRQIRITLTEKARALNKSYEAVSAQMNELFYKGFSDEEISRFETSLQKILFNLKAYEE
jgi:MarR family transcriptional regulator, organic hydroperoxide resistance regulator